MTDDAAPQRSVVEVAQDALRSMTLPGASALHDARVRVLATEVLRLHERIIAVEAVPDAVKGMGEGAAFTAGVKHGIAIERSLRGTP